MAKPSFAWIAPEYEFRPKEVGWFWLSIIFAVIILAAAIWQKNFLFVAFIIIAEILVIVWGNRPPRLVNFHLTETHLVVNGKKSYALGEMEYWSLDEPPHVEWANIIIHFKRPFHWGMHIHVPKAHTEDIRELLGAGARETHREEKLIDIFEEFLGF